MGITGFDMTATPEYIYVDTNMKGDDYLGWDTWRVSLDGKRKAYCGGSINLFVPPTGKYMYFTGYGWELYRTDFSFEHFERITVDIPDRSTIEDAIEPTYVACGDYSIQDDWLYFKLYVDNLYGGSYTGGYKMKLSGGEAVKTDDGEWYTPGLDDE